MVQVSCSLKVTPSTLVTIRSSQMFGDDGIPILQICHHPIPVQMAMWRKNSPQITPDQEGSPALPENLLPKEGEGWNSGCPLLNSPLCDLRRSHA